MAHMMCAGAEDVLSYAAFELAEVWVQLDGPSYIHEERK